MGVDKEKQSIRVRPYGVYMTKKRGQWTPARYTLYGWDVSWSNWYQNDEDFDEIGEKVKET